MTNSIPRYNCPGCGTALTWDKNNPHRPFCSEQCKNRDFIAWANEENRLPGSSVYDDILSNDLDSH
ncbi:MAG TPA: DNA gyrase inhibitor YacG [Pseudomonadales bacterium]